jgi:rubrerythrin
MHIAPTEILEIAIAIETNGAIFYRRAADSTDDPEIRKLCLRLAAEEDDHRAKFERIYSHEGIPLDLYDGNREAHAYIRALASSQICDDASLDLSSSDRLLETAIILEKESLLYYQYLKDGTAQEKNQKLLEEIIAEEQTHVIRLNEQLERDKKNR